VFGDNLIVPKDERPKPSSVRAKILNSWNSDKKSPDSAQWESGPVEMSNAALLSPRDR
jgi:hypothetical protein